MIGISKSRRDWVYRAGSALALALIGTAVFAISDTDFQGQINYDFRPPGARSLAMAGAFTSIADDSTTALFNPAGLTQLKRPEFALAGKVWTDNTHLDWGSGTYALALDPIGGQPVAGTQTEISRQERDFNSTKAGPAFMSYVQPFKHATFSIYGAQVMNYENSFQRDEIQTGIQYFHICAGFSGSFNCSTANFYSFAGFNTALTRAQGKINLYRYGVSGAFQIGKRLSLGLTAFYGKLKYHTASQRYATASVVSDRFNILNIYEDSEESRPGFGGGVLYRGDKIHWGLSYQRGERFSIQVSPFIPRRTDGVNDCAEFQAAYLRCPFSTDLKIPDRITAGISMQPNPFITLSADLEGIRWSQMASKVDAIQPTQYENRYEIKDAYNPHLGAEYVLLADTSPLAVRAGIWWEHGHNLKYTGSNQDVHNVLISILDDGFGNSLLVEDVKGGDATTNSRRLLFPGGGSQQHYTAGIGFVVGKIQFDAGYDYAKWTRQFVLSSVVRF